MGTTIISWTPTNWVTVFLMAAGGFLVVRTVMAAIGKAKNNGGS